MSKLIVTSPGPRNAYTDSRTGLRFYRWKGIDYPSVTTVRRMAGLPFMLHQWQLSRVIERAITQNDTLTEMLNRPRRPRERVLEKNRIKETSRWLRAAATEERDASAELGTRIHDAATQGLMLSEVGQDARPRLRQFYNWLDDSGIEIIAVEKQVWNLTEGYAGTLDILGRFPDGAIYVIDLKTGKGTWTEHALQLIGYSMGEFVGENDIADPELTKLLRSANGIAILHLTDERWKWQEVKVTPRLYEAFVGLLKFAVFAHEFSEIDSLLEDEIEGSAA